MRSIALSTLLVVGALSLGAGCATTTKITTDPPGATVTLEKDKKELGKTPLTYESKMWIWESEKVVIKAPGRKPKTVEIKRSEFDALPFLGGACLTLLPPCFCVQGLPIILAGGFKMPAETKVALEKDASGGDPAPAAAPAPAPAPAAMNGVVEGDAVAMTY
jgi:hypothetical protein